MGPYRTAAFVEPDVPNLAQHPELPSDAGLPLVFILVGGGRLVEAIALHEPWGGEVSICLLLLVLGVYELALSIRRH